MSSFKTYLAVLEKLGGVPSTNNPNIETHYLATDGHGCWFLRFAIKGNDNRFDSPHFRKIEKFRAWLIQNDFLTV